VRGLPFGWLRGSQCLRSGCRVLFVECVSLELPHNLADMLRHANRPLLIVHPHERERTIGDRGPRSLVHHFDVEGVARLSDGCDAHKNREHVVVAGGALELRLLSHHQARDEIANGPVEFVQTQVREIVHAADIEVMGVGAEKNDAYGVCLAQSNTDLCGKPVIVKLIGEVFHIC